MPLRIAESPVLDRGTDFLIFYSSIVDEKMWCPDCRAVDDVVQQTFAAADAPVCGYHLCWRQASMEGYG
ncbi:hypothetical protein FB45DRAFT_561021 [Roridomyces roridus]|uniref:Thioredoxin domain-containing protein n=1 Tax=Roridomyces roridus TaxID=1738132 RepID=A0AAD7FP93_9AGAR|nr:hypothetical protein FB45DRAFT_561021 [Roridomyces roridus]